MATTAVLIAALAALASAVVSAAHKADERHWGEFRAELERMQQQRSLI
jgi:hypothetical protein